MSLVVPIAFAAALSLAGIARAGEAADFIGKFSGEWLGTGQVLLGAASGLKFHCALTGDPSRTRLTFGMTGRCWMGRLSAPVYAQLRFHAPTGQFYGEFMDGADGDGVDVVGTRIGEGFSMQLSRGTVQGRLAAEAVNADQMVATIYYRSRVQKRELPVVALGFTRKGAGTSLPDFLPEIPTGSIAGME